MQSQHSWAQSNEDWHAEPGGLRPELLGGTTLQLLSCTDPFSCQSESHTELQMAPSSPASIGPVAASSDPAPLARSALAREPIPTAG